MGVFQAILVFFEALPKIIGLIERIVKIIQDKKVEAWLNDLEATIGKVEKAQTVEEKRDAAKSLVGIVRRIGS